MACSCTWTVLKLPLTFVISLAVSIITMTCGKSCPWSQTTSRLCVGEKTSPPFGQMTCKLLLKKLNLLIAPDALSVFSYHNKCLAIYIDSSDYQLGTCIMQDGQQIACNKKSCWCPEIFYSCQKRYVVHCGHSGGALVYAPWCQYTCFYQPQELNI